MEPSTSETSSLWRQVAVLEKIRLICVRSVSVEVLHAAAICSAFCPRTSLAATRASAGVNADGRHGSKRDIASSAGQRVRIVAEA